MRSNLCLGINSDYQFNRSKTLFCMPSICSDEDKFARSGIICWHLLCLSWQRHTCWIKFNFLGSDLDERLYRNWCRRLINIRSGYWCFIGKDSCTPIRNDPKAENPNGIYINPATINRTQHLLPAHQFNIIRCLTMCTIYIRMLSIINEINNAAMNNFFHFSSLIEWCSASELCSIIVNYTFYGFENIYGIHWMYSNANANLKL